MAAETGAAIGRSPASMRSSASQSLAAAYFKRADAVENWTAGDGKEVLAYFIGREALAAGRFVDATAAFSESMSLNPNYARPYIGLGNVLG
jgi:Flp pilus assembly protein TadD